ncbi:hypothetical protein GN956_G3754 [Arapaima gigas]
MMEMDMLGFALSLLLGVVSTVTEGTERQYQEGQNASLLCTDTLSNDSVSLRWKINRTGGEVCFAMFRFDLHQLTSTCESRVALNIEGSRAVLHISDLQESDKGSYTCEYFNSEETKFIQFHISIVACNTSNSSEIYNSYMDVVVKVSGVTIAALLVAACVLLRRILLGPCRTQKETTASSSKQDLSDIEPYSMFVQKNNGLYSTLDACT